MTDLQEFKNKFGHGHFRDIRGGVEVRVKDLDRSKEEANRIITNNRLDLEISRVDIRLRSFDVVYKTS